MRRRRAWSFVKRQRCPLCVSRSGRAKLIYAMRTEARKAANEMTAENGIPTRVYACPYGLGYHITEQREET